MVAHIGQTVRLLSQVKCPLYVVHVMSKSAAKVIMEKRKEGAVSFHKIIFYSSAVERQCILAFAMTSLFR